MTTSATPLSLDVTHRKTDLFITSQSQSNRRLYLPHLNSTVSVDECLSTHPVFYSKARQSFALKRPLTISRSATVSLLTDTPSSSPPVIYIHQREVGYVSSNQYDDKGALLVSDAATTCHILAMRSTSSNATRTCGYADEGNKNRVLGSICHLDSTKNGSCIRAMVARHSTFHIDDRKGTCSRQCRIEIHIMGGYRDKTNQSSEITCHIIELFAELAAEYLPRGIIMELSTCVVTSLNDRAFFLTNDKGSGRDNTIKSQPLFGGMSLDVNNGAIQLLSTVSEPLRGPDATLRRVRLWSPSSPSSNTHNLIIVHTEEEERLVLPPFEFSPFPDINLLLAMPDEMMLQYTSTSPDCEADDFCDLVRETLLFLRDVNVEDVFRRKYEKRGNGNNNTVGKYEAVVYRWGGRNWHKEGSV